MTTTIVPTFEEVQQRIAPSEAHSLITSLGLVESEVLTYLETYGPTTLRRVIRELSWPAPMVMMGVGALVRQGLARAVRHDVEVLLQAVPASDRFNGTGCSDAPTVWGG